MKLENLFESAQHQDFAYDTLNGFRDLAKEVHLGLGSDMGWPRISKDKVIFGMTFSELTKYKSAKQEPVEDRLPILIRVKSFLIKLAKKLSALMKAGHTVVVYNKNRYQNSEGTPATEENILELLKNHLQMDTSFGSKVEPGPTILFSVSTPKLEKDEKLYGIKFGVLYEDVENQGKLFSKRAQVYTFVSSDDTEFAELARKVKSEHVHRSWSPGNATKEEWEKTVDRAASLIQVLFKNSGIKLPKLTNTSKAVTANHSAIVTIDAYRKYGVRMERDEFIEKIIKPLLDS